MWEHTQFSISSGSAPEVELLDHMVVYSSFVLFSAMSALILIPTGSAHGSLALHILIPAVLAGRGFPGMFTTRVLHRVLVEVIGYPVIPKTRGLGEISGTQIFFILKPGQTQWMGID